jgi:hypothetical protein
MALGKAQLVDLYRKRAPRYDWSAQLYYVLGFREWAYRKKAVRALRLRPGDTVVEIGCGTGLNFGLLQEAVGPTVLLPLFRPFGVTLDLADRHPWESMRRYLPRFGMEDYYFGYTYIAWGEK